MRCGGRLAYGRMKFILDRRPQMETKKYKPAHHRGSIFFLPFLSFPSFFLSFKAWVASVRHPLSPVIRLGLRTPRNVCVALFYDLILGNHYGPGVSSCVLLCFIKPILGNRYGPGVSSRASQGGRTHDPISPTSLLTLSPLR